MFQSANVGHRINYIKCALSFSISSTKMSPLNALHHIIAIITTAQVHWRAGC